MAVDESNELKIGIGYSFTGTELQRITDSMESINRCTEQVASGFKSIENALSQLNNAQSRTQNSTSELDREYKQLRNEVNNLMNDMKSGHESTTNTIEKLKAKYKELDEQLAKAEGDEQRQARIKAIQAQIMSSIDQSERRITQIRKANLNEQDKLHDTSIQNQLRLEREKVQELKNIWQQEITNYKSLQKQMDAQSTLKDFSGNNSTLRNSIFNSGLQLFGVREVASEFQKLKNEIVDIDYKLVNTQRIMHDFSDETANYLLDNAVEMAKSTNTQITDAQKIQSAWVRINDTYASNKELLSEISMMTSKFMNVGEIENAEDAVMLLNASLLQFNKTGSQSAKYAEEFANKWAYMADITAMGTADEYGEAISKYGAQVEALNGSMDDAIALASVMADKLAKNGAEAGNSLKTITTYLNREKTRNLFSTIAEDLGDTSFQLEDANGKLKDFDETLRKVAEAYNIYKQAGNDVMAQKVLDAIGATRQRDAALAVINSINDESYDKYLSELQSDAVNGYLDEQNTALLETFAAQWNELKVSIEEFGMAMARSGILDGVGLLMNGFSGLLDIISKIPQPILYVVNAFIGLKAAKSAASYIGELTGATQKYHSLINQGTSSEIEQANAINQSVNAYKARQEAYVNEMMKKAQLGQLNKEELNTLSQQISMYGEQYRMFDELEHAYNNGIITASEYKQSIKNIVSEEQLSASAHRMSREELLQKTGVLSKAEVQQKAETNATKENTQAENDNTASKQRGIAATLKSIAQTTAATFTIKKEANEKVALALKNKLLDSSLMSLIANTTTYNMVGNIAGGVFTFIGNAAAAASAGVAAFMAALNPILAVVSIGTTIWSLGSMLFGGIGESSEDATEQLNEMQQELDETKTRLEELQDIEKRNGLTDSERAELQYLEEKNSLLEQSIKLKQQEQNNDAWLNHQGGFLGFGGEDSGKEELDSLILSYQKAKTESNAYALALEKEGESSQYAATWHEKLEESNEQLRSTSADLVQQYYDLDKAINEGTYSGEALESIMQYRDTLLEMMPELSSLVEEHYNLSDSIRSVTDETDAYAEEISGLNDKISYLNDLFDEYNKEGYLSYETVSKLVSEHPEYVRYLVKVGDQYKLNKVAEEELNQANKDVISTTDELISKLDEEQKIGQLVTDGMVDAVDAVDYFTTGIRNTFGNIEGVDKFIDDLREINVTLLKGESSIDEYNTSMNDLINNTDFSKVHADMSKLDDEAKQVAQSQQAMFTSLAQEVANYMQEATNALYQGQMSIADYVNTLQGSNENLLDMIVASENLTQNQEGMWVDANGALVEYANNLQNTINQLNGMGEVANYVSSCYEQMSLAAENNAAIVQENGQIKVDTEWWASEEGMNAANAMRDNFLLTMQDLSVNNAAAYNDIVDQTATATGMTRDQVIAMLQDNTTNSQASAQVVGAGTTAMMAMVGDAAGQATSAAGDVFAKLGEVVESFDYTIDFGVEGSINAGGNLIDLAMGKDFKPTSTLKLKLNGHGGSSVQGLAASLKSFGSSLNNLAISNYLSKIQSYNPSRSSIGSGGIASNYKPTSSSGSGSGSSASRNTPATRTPTSKSSSGSGKSAAEKAAEEAAKAAEEAAKAIEKLTNEYIKNVESMQDRIAKALKKKYQEQYDERKKLLEKEHNERVSQIQAEIDAINGDRPEDKQSELARLQSKLEKWKNDDSTLGKAKQKEYMDAIADLQKEIKLDELQKQLDEENENYENSIDSESEFYDAILKKLDLQMSDEYLYKEANYLIANNKQQEIIDLLTKYDSQWDGWATLMGKTAGEVIAEEVRLALANYKDVTQGTITPDGGKYTNAVSGGTSSSSSSSSSSSKTVSTGKKVKITNGNAGMYYTSTAKNAVNNWRSYASGQYYVVNDKAGRVALAKTNNVNSAIGWIDKKYVVALATGGYTGDYEGLAYLHQKERVLSAQQTSAFDTLVYDFLPRIDSLLANPQSNTFNNGNSVVFNKPLVSVNIDKLNQNKEFDVENGIDNLGRMVKNSLQKSGINLKK